jgi:hypothetical protein
VVRIVRGELVAAGALEEPALAVLLALAPAPAP